MRADPMKFELNLENTMSRHWHRLIPLAAAAGLAAGAAAAATAAPEKVRVTGEMMDTWCYLSGVMGPPEATLGSAHHTCATWCAAGGIPVGVLGEDGTVYFVLKLEGAGSASGVESVLKIQSHKVTVDAMLYKRDGQNYLVVDKIVADAGITPTHDTVGVVPPFAIPESVLERMKKQ